MPPRLTTATNSLPSADEATEAQLITGAPVGVQVAPESGETKIVPLDTAATSLAPSADEATALQLLTGAPVWLQVWASAGFSASKQQHKVGAVRGGFLVFIVVPPSMFEPIEAAGGGY